MFFIVLLYLHGVSFIGQTMFIIVLVVRGEYRVDGRLAAMIHTATRSYFFINCAKKSELSASKMSDVILHRYLQDPQSGLFIKTLMH